MNIFGVLLCVFMFLALMGLLYSIVFTDNGKKYCKNCKYYHKDDYHQCHCMRRVTLGSKYEGSLRTHNIHSSTWMNSDGYCSFYEAKDKEVVR